MEDIIIDDIGLKKYKSVNYLTYAINQTYSLSDNSQFYAFVNPSYYDYYWRIVRINLQWYDGFVVGIHNLENGIASTRIATTIVNGIAKQVLGSDILFKAKDESSQESLDYISNEWSKKSNFKNATNLMVRYSLASGTSAMVLNYAFTDLWCEAVRQDYFYCETDFRGNVVDFTRYIKGYLNLNGAKENCGEDFQNYFLVEHRKFGCYKEIVKKSFVNEKGVEETRKYCVVKKNVPLIEYQVYHYTGQMLTSKNMVGNVQKGLDWKNIPKSLRDSIKKNYSSIVLNKEMRLPFKDTLGVVLCKYDLDGSVPAGQFGTGVLTNIRSDLIDYECCHAYALRDMYNAQGQVGVPKTLTTGKLTGVANIYSQDKMNYETYEGNPDTQKPIITQFDFRPDGWQIKEDSIFKSMATKLNTSPKMLASYMTNANVQKTATQVDSDDDSVIAFIDNARSQFSEPINEILETVSSFYAKQGGVEVKFSSVGGINKDAIVDRVIKMFDAGFIDLREAIREINPDDSEAQIDDKLIKAQTRQNELNSQVESNINGLGDFNV